MKTFLRIFREQKRGVIRIDSMTTLSSLTNQELIQSLKSLVGDERSGLVSILKHLSEFEKRKLAEEESYPSLFEYCVRELRYAQGEAFRRIRAARAAAKFETIYSLLERGELNLTTVAALEPHLTWENHRRLIKASMGLGSREVEALVASLNPVAAIPAERIRMLAVAKLMKAAPLEDMFAQTEMAPIGVASSESAPMTEAPAAEADSFERRAHFSFTADEGFLRDYERAKELSRHKWPAGRQEEVFAGAIKALLDKIDPDKRSRRKDRVRKAAAAARSRHIARAVKDEVWARDGGRCGHAGDGGRVCGARAGLQFDHVKPWALGGGGGADNVRLLCRAHNDLEARKAFGSGVIDAAISRRRGRLAEGAENI